MKATRNVPADLLTREQREFLDGIDVLVIRSYVRARLNRETTWEPKRKCRHKVYVEGCPRCKRALYLKGKENKVLAE